MFVWRIQRLTASCCLSGDEWLLLHSSADNHPTHRPSIPSSLSFPTPNNAGVICLSKLCLCPTVWSPKSTFRNASQILTHADCCSFLRWNLSHFTAATVLDFCFTSLPRRAEPPHHVGLQLFAVQSVLPSGLQDSFWGQLLLMTLYRAAFLQLQERCFWCQLWSKH